MNEHEFEPVPGLPENLPDGETIHWQGAPDWKVLARRTFHLRILGGYFALLLALRVGTALVAGTGATAVFTSTAILAGLGLFAAGMFALYALLIARTTLYTITSKRLVMRFGIALPITINVPYSRIQAGAVKHYKDGYGDIPLTLDDSHRVSYVVMWPHVRPWQFRRPQPMLRGVPDAGSVAELLAEAVARVGAARQVETVVSGANSDDRGRAAAMPLGEMS